MVSGGWLPDPDCTVVVPFASVTVNVTFNAASPFEGQGAATRAAPCRENHARRINR